MLAWHKSVHGSLPIPCLCFRHFKQILVIFFEDVHDKTLPVLGIKFRYKRVPTMSGLPLALREPMSLRCAKKAVPNFRTTRNSSFYRALSAIMEGFCLPRPRNELSALGVERLGRGERFVPFVIAHETALLGNSHGQTHRPLCANSLLGCHCFERSHCRHSCAATFMLKHDHCQQT